MVAGFAVTVSFKSTSSFSNTVSDAGGVAVVDVRVAGGYTPAMAAAVSNTERKS